MKQRKSELGYLIHSETREAEVCGVEKAADSRVLIRR